MKESFTPRARRPGIAGLVLLCWLIILFGRFVLVSQVDWVHLFTLRTQLPLAEYLDRIAPTQLAASLAWGLFGITIFSICCICVGLAVLQGRWRAETDALGKLTSAFVVGEVIYAIVFLSLIVLWGLPAYAVAVVLVLGFLLGVKPALSWWAAQRGRRAALGFRGTDGLVLGLLAAILLISLLYSSSILGYDAAVEYFSHAKIMAMTGQPVYLYTKEFFPVGSFHATILYTGLIDLFGDESARLLTWANGLVIVLIAAAIGREAGLTTRARLYAAALILSTTAFVDVLGDGKVDLVCTAPLMAAVYWMARSHREPSRRTFTLIGFLLGFAMIARAYNAVLALAFVALYYSIQAVALQRRGESSTRVSLTQTAWILPPMLALGAFHLWQNAAWLGNALAPIQAAKHVRNIARAGELKPDMLLVYRLLYVVMHSTLSTAQSAGIISPLFLGFLPLALARGSRRELRSRPVLVFLIMAAAATLTLWIWGFTAVVEIRYVLFLWLLLFLPVAQLMDTMSRQTESLARHFVAIPVILLLIYMAGRSLDISVATYAPVDSSGQPHCNDLRYDCTIVDQLNRLAAPGSRVFVLNPFRYYLRPDLFACSSLAEDYARMEHLAQSRSPEFWTDLYKGGYRYLTYDVYHAVDHVGFGDLPSLASTPPWLHVMQLSSSQDGLARVYEIWATSAPYQPDAWCERSSAGNWTIQRPAGRALAGKQLQLPQLKPRLGAP